MEKEYFEEINKEETREVFESFKKLPQKQLDLIYTTADWEYINKSEFAAVYDLLRPYFHKNLTLLDVGCGDGRFLIPLQGKFELSGLDFSKSFLAEVRKYCRGCRLYFGDAEKLPFKENSFDIVLSVRLIQHLSKKQQRNAISQMYKVAKAGGRAIVLNYNSLSFLNLYKKVCQSKIPKFWPFLQWRWLIDEYNNPFELAAMFRKAGFRKIKVYGSTLGEPDLLRLTKISHYLGNINKSFMKQYYGLCGVSEKYSRRSFLAYFMNRVIVVGEK